MSCGAPAQEETIEPGVIEFDEATRRPCTFSIMFAVARRRVRVLVERAGSASRRASGIASSGTTRRRKHRSPDRTRISLVGTVKPERAHRSGWRGAAASGCAGEILLRAARERRRCRPRGLAAARQGLRRRAAMSRPAGSLRCRRVGSSTISAVLPSGLPALAVSSPPFSSICHARDGRRPALLAVDGGAAALVLGAQAFAAGSPAADGLAAGCRVHGLGESASSCTDAARRDAIVEPAVPPCIAARLPLDTRNRPRSRGEQSSTVSARDLASPMASGLLEQRRPSAPALGGTRYDRQRIILRLAPSRRRSGDGALTPASPRLRSNAACATDLHRTLRSVVAKITSHARAVLEVSSERVERAFYTCVRSSMMILGVRSRRLVARALVIALDVATPFWRRLPSRDVGWRLSCPAQCLPARQIERHSLTWSVRSSARGR